MQDFETEEQQIEALKKWWHENGTSLIIGLSLGVAAIFGGRYYINMQETHSANASDLYFQVIEHVSNKSEEAAMTATDKLIIEYKDTPYAALASLLMARYEFELAKIDETSKQLDWVVKNAEQSELQSVARLRLARIHLANSDYDAAENLLNAIHSPAFDAAFEELKGDIYVARNQLAEARVAYDKAIVAYGVNASTMLRLKRQDLGTVDANNNQVEPPA